MKAAAQIATVTVNPAIDESTEVASVTPDRKLRCAPSLFHPGGGGINVSRAIRRLGGDSIAVLTSGGPTGRRLEALLTAEGVRLCPIRIDGWTRENLNVQELSTGRQYRFCKSGPALIEEEWRRCLNELESLPAPDYFVASGSLTPGVPTDFYGRVALLARRRKTRMILDASGEALRQGTAEGVYLLKVSRHEFELLVGGPAGVEGEMISKARELVRAGRCEILVLSLGPAGALWVTASEDEWVPAPEVPVASSVGAGDTLVAGIVLSLVGSRSISEAVHFGVAAAAAAVMRPGTDLCRREDAERLYREMVEIRQRRTLSRDLACSTAAR